jgi:hypothetical protein
MSIFGWDYPAGCNGTPYDEESPEECPQCGAENSTEDGEPVCAGAPDFCSVMCAKSYDEQHQTVTEEE